MKYYGAFMIRKNDKTDVIGYCGDEWWIKGVVRAYPAYNKSNDIFSKKRNRNLHRGAQIGWNKFKKRVTEDFQSLDHCNKYDLVICRLFSDKCPVEFLDERKKEMQTGHKVLYDQNLHYIIS